MFLPLALVLSVFAGVAIWKVNEHVLLDLLLELSIVSCIICAVIYFSPLLSTMVKPERDTRPIRAVHMNDQAKGINGTFLIGCGHISGGDSEKYFWWYEVREDGSAAYCQNPCRKTKLFEDGRCEVVQYYRRTEFDWWHGFRESRIPHRNIELHIPENTILQAWEVQ